MDEDTLCSVSDLFNHIKQRNLFGLLTFNPDFAFTCFFFLCEHALWSWICRYLLYIFMKYSIVFFYHGVLEFIFVERKFSTNPNALLTEVSQSGKFCN